VKYVHNVEAVDDLSRDLKKPDVLDEPNCLYYTFRGANSSGPLKVQAEVRNPSRHASFIKTLKGEVGLFLPDESNGGVLKIPDALQNPTKPIQNPKLGKYKIKLVYWSKEVYEAKHKEVQQTKTEGLAVVKYPARSREIFGDFYSNMFSEQTNLILVLVKDPDKRVVQLEF